MTKVNFAASREKAEKEGLLGRGDYLKLQEGDNRIRLMSECLEHPGEYLGKATFKWLCYVLDRRDGKIKPFFMAHTIYKQIEAPQLNEDYRFDKGAGTKEVVYTLMPARANTPLTPAERALFTGTTPIADVQKSLYEKQPAPEVTEQVPDEARDDGPDIQLDMPEMPE